MKRSFNDVDFSQRTARPRPDAPDNVEDQESPLKEARAQMSTGSDDSDDEFLAEAERMTRDWERNPWPVGAAAFLKDPARRREYVETLANLLREASPPSPPR